MADMNELLKDIDQYLDIQRHNCNMKDPYDKGLYNGIELVRALITKEEPVYINSNSELDQEAMDRNPQRYI